MAASESHAIVKVLALAFLVLQNAALVLVMRYSQLKPKGDEPRYLATSAVMMGEVIKMLASLVFLASEKGFRVAETITSLQACCAVVRKPAELLSLCIPAFLYLIQNNLVYVAAANLDPAPFQLLFQLKIFTTALLSVWLLNRTLTNGHWRALVLLFCGVFIVQISAVNRARSDASPKKQSPMLGLFAILIAVTCSGLSGVWFEKILKGSSTSLWARNIQLALISLFLAVGSVWIKDWNEVSKHGLFVGYSPLVWMVVFLQSGGGLLVAVVVKYADNILKGFATSIATVISTIASVLWFDFEVSALFSIGAVLVLGSAYMYGKADSMAVVKAKSDDGAKIAAHVSDKV